MCRIFGFRSILQSGVHQSLIDADNAIIQQSQHHPDGWGVAYYKLGSPHLIKMQSQAKNCKIFQKVSGVVSSNTVIAHIRKSTVGEVGPLNTHPFQYGQWVFAHNGNIENFDKHREALLSAVDKELQSFILGETDSEVLFYIFLTELLKTTNLESGFVGDLKGFLQDYVDLIQNIIGPLSESQGDYHKNYLSFLITNGKSLIGFQGGQKLYYSTHKKLCRERGTCAFLKPSCEEFAKEGDGVQHLLVTSEKIQNENVWTPMSFGEFVGVDNQLKLFKGQLKLC